MKLFSQRKGIKKVKNVIQVNDIDDDLRNGLWNALTIYYWKQIRDDFISHNTQMNTFFNMLWLNYFKKPIDTLRDYWSDTYGEIRSYFFDCKWNEVYDFIEFTANNFPDKQSSINKDFVNTCNSILKRELSAYRFVGGKITQITSEEEISEIEEALEVPKPLKSVKTHLKGALDLLTNRESPDYRNSIKESISAIESICTLITGNKKGTLGQALKEIEDNEKVSLHPALKNSFTSLYGYTSNAEGIRHALLDESNLSFEDAKFMLVSCSAFVNYLINKASNAGIKL